MSTPPRQLAPFQFRLRTLFIATLVVAVISWLITILPPPLRFIFVFPTLPIVELTTCILGVVYLRGGRRAFWLGFGISLLQVVAVGTFFEFFNFLNYRGAGDWQVLFLIPLFVVVVPAVTGCIGVYFYRVGEAAKPPDVIPSSDVREVA